MTGASDDSQEFFKKDLNEVDSASKCVNDLPDKATFKIAQ